MHHTDARIAGWNALEIGVAVLAAIWLVSAGSYLWGAHGATGAGAGTPGALLILIVLVLPLALIGAMVLALRSLRTLRTEMALLQSSVRAMRQEPPRAETPRPNPARHDTMRQPQIRHSQTPPAARAAIARPPPSRASTDEQSVLAFDSPSEPQNPALSPADFILALQFPEGPDDHDGFRALRLALAERGTAKLIRAAQDALTLLAQEGIFVDDLMPDPAAPAIWRRFAAGERGRSIAAVGGVHLRSALALTAARMREDPVFRDAAHHFLRAFDRSFAAFERDAADDEIAAFAATRTARAFMLFGRVAGIFG
jgi:hypothetical protein